MILKIERYWGPWEKDPKGWWLLDDIRKISHQLYKDRSFAQDFADIDADIILLDYEGYLKNMNNEGYLQNMSIGKGTPEGRDVIKLVCRLSNGNEFIVLFDTIAYILNDNGKTIEKLVANYR